MISKGSRYEGLPGFTNENDRQLVFRGIRPRKIILATGVLEYVIKEGDRLDLLSLHFYDNTQRWWRILDANPHIIFGGDLTLEQYLGETLLIPRSSEPGED